MAFAVAALTALIAVKWLLRYIQSHRFAAFAIYRILFGGIRGRRGARLVNLTVRRRNSDLAHKSYLHQGPAVSGEQS